MVDQAAVASRQSGSRESLMAQRVYGENKRNAVVGVENRCGDGGDRVRAAGAVVRQRVRRGELHRNWLMTDLRLGESRLYRASGL